MLERKAWSKLEEWHCCTPRKALLIKGARQIGKTTLVRTFAKERYEYFAELNFLEDRKAAAIFDGNLDVETLIAALTAYLRKPLVPGKTLVLLDEVQECPNARAAIKFLVEDGRFDYVETGSLLGVKTRQVPSYPVGFEEHLDMFPLDFEEFCRANGVQQETLDFLEKAYADCSAVPSAMHETMMNLYRAYMTVGGMPEVVQRYVDTHDIAQVVALQQDLLSLYRLDIEKYAPASEKTKIRSIFDAVPAQLDDKNRRFILADLSKNARQNRYQSSFLWLSDAGVALPCFNATSPVTPLSANSKHNLFKLFMGDTGLLCAATFGNVQFDILQGNLEVNMGAITENVVAQELKAHGFDLFYLNTKRQGEIDFLVQDGNSVLPVEVKSGNSWTVHNALDKVMDVEEWKLGSAVVFCKGNVAREGNVTYLPLYMTMFLQAKQIQSGSVYEVDLSALSLR